MRSSTPCREVSTPVKRVDVHLYGHRGDLHARLRLPAHYVYDLPALLEAAQRINPAAAPDALIRTIWRLGCRSVQRNNERRVPVRTSELPFPRKVEPETA